MNRRTRIDMTIETKANRFLASETELTIFLAAWEACTLPKPEWTHAAHVAAAACYTWERTPPEALPRLRQRIRTFNEASGGQNTEDAGYHETLTHFWAEVVGSFVASRRSGNRLDAVRAAVERFGSARDLPQTYYTHDLVRDRVARRQWVPPERQAEFAEFLLSLG
jgi:hypothetical protein